MSSFNDELLAGEFSNILKSVFSNFFLNDFDDRLNSIIKKKLGNDLDEEGQNKLLVEFKKQCHEKINSPEMDELKSSFYELYKAEIKKSLLIRRQMNDEIYNITSEHIRGKFINTIELIKLFSQSEMILTDNISTDIAKYVLNNTIIPNKYFRNHIIGKNFTTSDERFEQFDILFKSTMSMYKNVHCIVIFNNTNGRDNKPVHVYITYARCTPDKMESNPSIYKGYFWDLTGFINNIGKIQFRLYCEIRDEDGNDIPIKNTTMEFWSITNLPLNGNKYADNIKIASNIEGNLIKTHVKND